MQAAVEDEVEQRPGFHHMRASIFTLEAVEHRCAYPLHAGCFNLVKNTAKPVKQIYRLLTSNSC